MLTMTRVKTAVAVVLAAVLILGTGSVLVWQSAVSTTQALAPAPPPKEPSEPAEIGGEPVDGLRLALIADRQILTDRQEVRLLPDASNAQEVKLVLTFTNVGKAPLKLDLWDLGFDEKLTVRVNGPEGGAEVRDIRPLIDRGIPPREPSAFVTLPPSGMEYFHLSSHGINTYCSIRLRKPGTYRIKVVYQAVDRQYPEAFAHGYWIGKVESNDVVLTVHPPARADD